MAGIGPGDRERIFAARHAGLARVDLAGPQILLGDQLQRVQVDEADRIVEIIGDQRTAAVRAHRDPRGLRLHVRAEPLLVAERDGAARRETVALPREHVHDVVHSASDHEPAAVGAPSDAAEAVRHRQGLQPAASARVHRIAEHILHRLRRDGLAVRPIILVVAAGEHQHFPSVRAGRDRRSAVGEIGRVRPHPHGERLEPRARRCRRRQALPGRQILGGRRVGEAAEGGGGEPGGGKASGARQNPHRASLSAARDTFSTRRCAGPACVRQQGSFVPSVVEGRT